LPAQSRLGIGVDKEARIVFLKTCQDIGSQADQLAVEKRLPGLELGIVGEGMIRGLLGAAAAEAAADQADILEGLHDQPDALRGRVADGFAAGDNVIQPATHGIDGRRIIALALVVMRQLPIP
jgi:hypothetical protein